MLRGLIGEKLGHSFSKTIHEQISGQPYQLIPLNEQEFHEFMRKKDFEAINVTIPYKEKVIPYCDEIDEIASSIQAVNCIKKVNGKLMATNSDYYGLKQMILSHKIDCQNKVVAVLGTGGTSKTALAVVKSLKPKQILQAGRNKPAPILTYEELKQHSEIEIIVNTTSVGMYPHNDEQVIDLADFPNCQGVIDVIYNPLKTALCLQAEKLGIPNVNGLEMLVGQAVKAVEFFNDTALDDQLISQITQSLRNERLNIVLIGMPSCGKSTIGKRLSKALKKPLIDLDAEIVKRTQQTIPEIFSQKGEAAFREYEKQVTQIFAAKHGQVIACGGGIIKNAVNIDRLKQNGCLIYLHRDLDKLIVDDSRPLSTSRERLAEMAAKRHPLYLEACDFEVDNNESVSQCIQQIKEKLYENYDY